MIKHKKIIICILLSYALFIVGIFNVKALDFSQYDIEKKAINSSQISVDKNVAINTSNSLVQSGSFDVVQLLNGYDLIAIPFQASIVMSYKADYNVYPQNTYQIYYDYGAYSVYSSPLRLFLSDHTANSPICYFDSNFVVCPITDALQNSYFKSYELYITNARTSQEESEVISGHISMRLTFNQVYFMKSKTKAIANSTSDINNKISDSSIDTNQTTSSTSSWGNKNATNGTITDLLTLPISLLQAIVNGISSSCSSFSLGSLFGTNITLPCINIGSLVGSTLWSTIDILFSGFMILAIAKKLIKIFNDFTNLKTNQVDELYGGGK